MNSWIFKKKIKPSWIFKWICTLIHEDLKEYFDIHMQIYRCGIEVESRMMSDEWTIDRRKKDQTEGVSAGQSGAPVRWSSLEGFWISTSADAESDWRIMLRDTWKHWKNVFGSVNTLERKENEEIKGRIVPCFGSNGLWREKSVI